VSKFILEDVIEEFMDEDSIEQDIHQHPVSWCIALLIVTPPLVAALLQMDDPRTDSALDSLGPLQSIVGLVMFMMLQTQLFIAPIACFALAYRRHLAPAVLVAMGSSAIMLTLDISTQQGFWPDGILGPVVAAACLAPFIIVLRKKRTQLNPGRSRQVWATLMATSILMFAVATLVPAVASYGESDVCTGVGLIDAACVDEWSTYGWASIGLVVAAIGWAWPRGRHIVEEIADDIIEAAT
jgi:Ca2+/H+ antiporter